MITQAANTNPSARLGAPRNDVELGLGSRDDALNQIVRKQ